jgi:hypothetical protein
VQILESSCFRNCTLLTKVIFESGSVLHEVSADAFAESPCAETVVFPPTFHRNSSGQS